RVLAHVGRRRRALRTYVRPHRDRRRGGGGSGRPRARRRRVPRSSPRRRRPPDDVEALMSDQLAGLPLLAWVPLLPLLGALINLTLGSRLSKGTVTAVAVGSVALACTLSFYLVFWSLCPPDASG